MRILWLKTELLHPVDKGGKIRTYHMLKQLRREHHITYLTLDDGESADARRLADEYCQELVCVPHHTRAKFSSGFYAELAGNLVSALPYAIKKYQSAHMMREVAERTRGGAFDILVCDFLTPSINVPSRIECATVLFQHNVEAMIWKRHYQVQSNPLKKAYLYDQWRKTHVFERATCRRFDHVIAVSREDREIMRSGYGIAEVSDVPTGVDTDYFRPDGRATRDAHNLVFTGSMDWLPNQDAIHYFTEQILPLIKKAVPGVTLTVVGRNPYPSLVELSRRDSSIVVTGRVDDVRPYIDRAAAYVVPIRIGGGTRLKIYEAMAMEKPVVSTTIGAEGLPVRDGTEIVLADAPEAFADAVVRVITDADYAAKFGVRAATAMRKDFGWDKVAQSFIEGCRRAEATHGVQTVELLQTFAARAVDGTLKD